MEEEMMIRSPDTLRQNRIPPGQRQTEKWPVLHYGTGRHIDAGRWTFEITGLVNPVRKLSYQEFTALPVVRVLSDIHCVTTWSRLDNLWEGVSTREIKSLTQVLPQAKYVMVHGDRGFTTNLSLEDFFAEDVLFAMKHDNEVLSPDHGYPVRLVVPRLYFWKSAKWVTGVEFMGEDRAGFWESHGYHRHGDPWKEERYS